MPSNELKSNEITKTKWKKKEVNEIKKKEFSLFALNVFFYQRVLVIFIIDIFYLFLFCFHKTQFFFFLFIYFLFIFLPSQHKTFIYPLIGET